VKQPRAVHRKIELFRLDSRIALLLEPVQTDSPRRNERIRPAATEGLGSYSRVGEREVICGASWQESGCRGNSYHPQMKCAQAGLKPVRQRFGVLPSGLVCEPVGLDVASSHQVQSHKPFSTEDFNSAPESTEYYIAFRKVIFSELWYRPHVLENRNGRPK